MDSPVIIPYVRYRKGTLGARDEIQRPSEVNTEPTKITGMKPHFLTGQLVKMAENIKYH